MKVIGQAKLRGNSIVLKEDRLKRRRAFRIAAIGLTVLLLLGLATVSVVNKYELWHPNTRLSRLEAIDIAERDAEARGVRLRDYIRGEIQFSERFREWFVPWDHRIPYPGGHFAVVVDDETSLTRFVPGL